MAIYVSKEFQEVNGTMHGMFESSMLKSTDIGRIYDAVVKEGEKEIEVDNGVALKIGEFVGDGLEQRYATIAKPAEKIAVTGQPAIIKVAFTKEQNQAYHFYNRAGEPVKTYEVTPDDIFAVANYQFTDASKAEIKVGAYVSVDGNGQWVAAAAEPSTAFVGKIHSIAADTLGQMSMVRILCVKNAE